MYNIFNRLINIINNFMYGRYGTDELNKTLIALCFVFWVLSFFTFLGLFRVIYLAVLIIICFRSFSKNIYARQKELQKYLKIKNKFINAFSLNKQKFQNRKTHKYFKCEKCRANLRVPKGRGKIEITCPKCKNIMIRHS